MYYVRKPQNCKNRKLLTKKHSSNHVLHEKYNTEKLWADLNFLFERNLHPSAERFPFSLKFVAKTTLLSDESIQTFNTSQPTLNYLPLFKINCKKFHLKFASDYLKHCSRWLEICYVVYFAMTKLNIERLITSCPPAREIIMHPFFAQCQTHSGHNDNRTDYSVVKIAWSAYLSR